MRNDWFRKGLVVGIIVLFIGISILPKINAYDNTSFPDVNEDIIPKTNGVVDVIITSVKIHKRTAHNGIVRYYQTGCIIKNIGDRAASQNAGFSVYADVYKARIFSNDTYWGHHSGYQSSTDKLAPGETRFICFHTTENEDIPFQDYLLRFECKVTCNFYEENTDNNYFEKTYFHLNCLLIPFPWLF